MKKLVVFTIVIVFYTSHIICQTAKKYTHHHSNVTKTINTQIDKNRKVQFGDIFVELPFLDGMKECYSDQIIKEKSKLIEKKDEIILGYYLNNNTYQNKERINEFQFDDYFKVCSFSFFKGVIIHNSDLNDFINVISKTNTDNVFEKSQNEIENEFKNISFGKLILCEKYAPNKSSKSILYLTKTINNDNENVLICVLTLIQIKNRMISFYYYKNYDGEESLKKAKAKSDYFSYLMLDANNKN